MVLQHQEVGVITATTDWTPLWMGLAHLMNDYCRKQVDDGSLHSVSDVVRKGVEGRDCPPRFQAVPLSRLRHCFRFWNA